MRLRIVVIALLLSGCVAELLADPEVSTRSLVCQVFDGDTPVEVVLHGAPDVDAAMLGWTISVGRVLEEEPGRFTWSYDALPEEDIPTWIEDQDFLGDTTRIHILFTEVDGTMEILAPAVLALNATVGAHRALLFHGLGHLLGVVNQGVPLHEPEGPERESPPGHTPGGPMSERWHRVESFPTNNTLSYGQDTIYDWQAFVADPRMCP